MRKKKRKKTFSNKLCRFLNVKLTRIHSMLLAFVSLIFIKNVFFYFNKAYEIQLNLCFHWMSYIGCRTLDVVTNYSMHKKIKQRSRMFHCDLI